MTGPADRAQRIETENRHDSRRETRDCRVMSRGRQRVKRPKTGWESLVIGNDCKLKINDQIQVQGQHWPRVDRPVMQALGAGDGDGDGDGDANGNGNVTNILEGNKILCAIQYGRRTEKTWAARVCV